VTERHQSSIVHSAIDNSILNDPIARSSMHGDRNMSPAVQQFDVIRVAADGFASVTDQVARESPLEVRLHGEPFAVIMRTPGSDRELTAGFLFSESIVARPSDIAGIDVTSGSDVVQVTLAGDRAAAVPAILGGRRQVAMNSSCGMCGRRTLASLDVRRAPAVARWRVSADVVGALPALLRAAQPIFADTGGLHAAALFSRDGRIEASAEDVGRHNAVDKLIGRMLLADRLPLAEMLIVVSGRSSFEIVQKAVLAGIPLIAAVSAPSSLAVDLARGAGLTLVGFVRDGRFNIYAHEARVDLTSIAPADPGATPVAPTRA
jgi:FdhD protein